jgi:hypothetical protein
VFPLTITPLDDMPFQIFVCHYGDEGIDKPPGTNDTEKNENLL